jgi:hypothetical protein
MLHCTEIDLQMGQNEYGSCTFMFESYVVNGIKKGVFIFLELFKDDSVMLLEMMSAEIFF